MTDDKPDEPEKPAVPRPPELKPKLPPRPDEAKDDGMSLSQRMGVAYMVPISLVAPIVALTLIGDWLDGRFHTGPWCTLGGALLGFVCGLINMIRVANKLDR